MGFIFDNISAQAYESWLLSPQGRVINWSLEKMIQNLLAPNAGERVLDIGCGSGNHLHLFDKMGLDVCGIDASPHMIAKSKARLGHRATLKPANAESLPFEDNEFDLAIFINSLEYLNDPLESLKEAGRVTRRKVFIGVMNSWSWNGFLDKTKGLLGDQLYKRARFYNFWQIKNLIRKAYGPVPIKWECIKLQPSFIGKCLPFIKDNRFNSHSPFGFFLGFSATIVYRVKADSVPLKLKIKKTGHSFASASPFQGLKKAVNSEQ